MWEAVGENRIRRNDTHEQACRHEELESRDSGSERVLLMPRTQVCFLALMSGSPQLSGTPAAGDWAPSSGLEATALTHVHAPAPCTQLKISHF